MPRTGLDKPAYFNVIQENVLTVMNAKNNQYYQEIINSASLCVPDGLPLVWAHEAKKAGLKKNVRGPELMRRYLQHSVGRGVKHFFYGGTPEILSKMVNEFEKIYPGIKIAGSHAPPYRDLTAEEDANICRKINASEADILWVSLGGFKQDAWMYEHRDKIKVKVMHGVGQAFSINAGIISEAPKLLQNNGLEWLYMLIMNPCRLFKRYIFNNPLFIAHVFLEITGLRKYPCVDGQREAGRDSSA